MPQSLVKILVHIVFSTKERRLLIPRETQARLFGYIGGIIANNGGRMIVAGGMADHLHLLVSIGRMDISELIGDIKRDSSSWMKKEGVLDFYWQRGYGAFSIGQSQVPGVRNYILTQEEHHAGMTYQDEFRSLCRKYDVEIDEGYCWD
jgi:putative transposase